MGRLSAGAALAPAALLALLPLPARAHVERRVAPGELRAALARARPGDVLRLDPGVHRGPITVGVRVRLAGEPGAVIDGGGRGTVVTLAADGAALEDLEIRGSGADLSADDAVVRLRSMRRGVVRGCRIRARAFGIYLEGGGHHRIVSNQIRGDASLAPARRGNGIHLWSSSRNEIRANRIADVRDGVYLSFAHRNRIRRNQGTGLRYGIHYMYSERNELAANHFDGCTGGIALMFSLSNRITGNVATGNRDFGILCQQIERSVVRANRAAGNARGLFVENSAGNRFVANRVESNAVGVFLTAGSEGNVFTRNRFRSNLVPVFEDRGGGQRWSEAGLGNLWADYVGLDWDGDGIGDRPYRLRTARAALLARRPAARWFLTSPALALLDWWDTASAPAAGDLDPAPIVDPVKALARHDGRRARPAARRS